MANEEVWKPVAGFEGKYEVSNFGNVRTLNYRRKHEENKLAQGDMRGYSLVVLYKDGKAKNCMVHRLVANAFIPNPKRLPYVNHIDENKSNNNATNLEWCTPKYNANYGERNKKVSQRLMNCKSTSKPVTCTDSFGRTITFPSIKEAHRQTGIDIACISRCCRGQRKTTHKLKFAFIKEDDYE